MPRGGARCARRAGAYPLSVPITAPGIRSLAVTVPAILTVAGSPALPPSGTLAIALVNQSANLVFAGPGTGAAAAPTFRALVAADLPAGAGSPLTTKGDLYTYDSATARLPIGANNTVLVADSAQATGNKWSATLSGLTLTTPTIADLTNATHSHQNAAGGGTLDAAAIASGTLATARTDYSPVVILAPASSARNAIQPSGDFTGLTVKGDVTNLTAALFVAQNSDGTNSLSVSATGVPTGKSPNQFLSGGLGNINLYTSDSFDVDVGAMLTMGGSDGGSATRSFAAIAGRKENATSANRAGYLQFITRNGGAGELTERGRITSAGLWGIGMGNPTAKIDIAGIDSLLNNYGLKSKSTSTELITLAADRDFSSSTGNWTGTGWAISGGTFNHTVGNTADGVLANSAMTASQIVSGNVYKIVFTVSARTAGTVTPKVGTTAGQAVSLNGVYTQYVSASGNNVNVILTPTTAFDGSIDNVSVTRLADVFMVSNVGGVSVKHLIGLTTAVPTIAAGAGAGTSPTVTLSATATDLAGVVNVTTGTTPSAAGVVVTITFNFAYGSAPNILLTPGNSATAALSGATHVYVTSTTTTFVINAGASALAASTAYTWFYMVMQ